MSVKAFKIHGNPIVKDDLQNKEEPYGPGTSDSNVLLADSQ